MAEPLKVGDPPYACEPDTATARGMPVSPLASWDATGVPSPLAMSYPLMAGNWPPLVAL